MTEPLTWVDLDLQRIEWMDAQRVRTDKSILERASKTLIKKRVVLALHKPAGVVTTRKDERGRRTVYHLLPPDLPWVFPAGRLDADSEGLLILTNDSALAVHLTEPTEHVPKTYQVTVRGQLSEKILNELRHGVKLADGPTRPAQVRVIHSGTRSTILEMTLTEGRNRQIRRMWHAVGNKVRKLVRIGIGKFPLGDLKSGEWRFLSAKEVQCLMKHEGISLSKKA